MMKKRQFVLATALLLSAFALDAASLAQPKLSLNRNNIKVWTYKTDDNPVIQYKAETTFDVPIERAVALIVDVERTPQWVPYMGKVKLLSRDEKKGEFTLYMVLDFPFPLKDRDVVVQGKMTKSSDGIIRIVNRAMKTDYPLQPNSIRLTDYEGDWQFQKLGANKVKVTTSGYADPAGTIPLTFVNMFVEQQPYQMLLKMKTELKNPLYQQIKLPEVLQ